MIYLSDSIRRQHCVRLGAIILFKLNVDKRKTNLLPLCTIDIIGGIALFTFAICHFFRELYVHLRLCQQAFSTNSGRFQ